jgi:shikimate kinase
VPPDPTPASGSPASAGPGLTRPVVLVGMMGAGKTAVGTALARLLAVRFTDSDDAIERAANMSIPEIFARDGEAFFREKEAQVLARLLRDRPGVLSTGGGAFLSERNRAAIAARGVSVWLRATPDLLWQRVRHRTSRPLLMTADPRGTLLALHADRAPVYALADLTVDSLPGVSIEDMALRVRDALAARGGVLGTGNGGGKRT